MDFLRGKSLKIATDIGIKIGIDTLLSRERPKRLVIKFDELIHKLVISSFYFIYIEDMLIMRFKKNETLFWGDLMNFFTSVAARSAAEIISRIVWNTLHDVVEKQANAKLTQAQIKTMDVGFLNIVVSNLISQTVLSIYDVVTQQLDENPTPNSLADAI